MTSQGFSLKIQSLESSLNNQFPHNQQREYWDLIYNQLYHTRPFLCEQQSIYCYFTGESKQLEPRRVWSLQSQWIDSQSLVEPTSSSSSLQQLDVAMTPLAFPGHEKYITIGRDQYLHINFSSWYHIYKYPSSWTITLWNVVFAERLTNPKHFQSSLVSGVERTCYGVSCQQVE